MPLRPCGGCGVDFGQGAHEAVGVAVEDAVGDAVGMPQDAVEDAVEDAVRGQPMP